jgi:hypothetical protein
MSVRTCILIPALTVAAALALSGCAPLPGLPGPRVTEDREVESVESVVVRTSGDLRVTVGDTPSLRITAPATVMDRLTSEIVAGELVLGARAPYPGLRGAEIDYDLVVPRLTGVLVQGSSDVDADFTGADRVRITIEGSGDVEATGIDAAEVVSSIEGSGDISLSGAADELRIVISGSGDVDADDLVSEVARVEVSGSGDVEVHATASLDAEISGSGWIRYSGAARVTSDVSESGSIVASRG